MLNSIIIFTLNSFGFFEKISDGSMAGQYYAQHSEDIECRPSKLAVVLDNGHEAVCDDCNISLLP